MQVPSTGSPSLEVSTIFCQAIWRSALRFESWIRPPSPSMDSSRTSMLSPTLSSLRLGNSSLGMSPSLLRPTSTTTSSPEKPMILPWMSVPVSRESMRSSSRSSMPPVARSPRASESRASASASSIPSDAISVSSIMHFPSSPCDSIGSRARRCPRGPAIRSCRGDRSSVRANRRAEGIRTPRVVRRGSGTQWVLHPSQRAAGWPGTGNRNGRRSAPWD